MDRPKPEFSLDKPVVKFIKVGNEDLEEFRLSFEDFFSLGVIPVQLGKFSQLHIANDNEPVAKRNDEFYRVKHIDRREITYVFSTTSFDNVLAVTMAQKSANIRITIQWRPDVSTRLFDQKGFLRLFLAWLEDFYSYPLPKWANTDLDMWKKAEPLTQQQATGGDNMTPGETSGQQPPATEDSKVGPERLVTQSGEALRPKEEEKIKSIDAIVEEMATREIDRSGNILTSSYNTAERVAIARLWRRWRAERGPTWMRFKHAQHFHIPEGTLGSWITNYNG